MNNNFPATEDDEIDLLTLAGTLWDNRWLIGAITAVFALLGIAYVLLATPIYRATSLVQVEEKQGVMPGMEDLSEMIGSSPSAVTEIEIIKSRSVLGQVVDSLKLDIRATSKYFPVVGSYIARGRREKDALAEALFAEHYAWGGEHIDIDRLEVPAEQQGQPHTLEAGENGRWSFYNEAGQEVLSGQTGTLAENSGYALLIPELRALPGTHFQLVKRSRLSAILNLQSRIKANEQSRNSGMIQLALEHPSRAQAERILNAVGQHYVQQNVERNSAEAAQSLEFIQNKLPEMRSDLAEAENELNAYQVRAESIDIGAEATALLDQFVELEKQISELEMQRAEIEQRFRQSHPRYQAWSEQMAELRERRSELDNRIRQLPETQQELVRLRRDVEVGNEIYLQMLSNAQQLRVARAGTVGNVRVVDQAAAGPAAVKPKKQLVVLIATLVGGLLGTVLVLLRAAFNRGVEDPDEIEAAGLPVYASIPQSNIQETLSRDERKKQHQHQLLALENPEDPAVESLRSLRTSLHFGMMEARTNVLMISGASPGTGKTFVACNLAALVAQAQRQVLIIDGDMRRGSLHRLFRHGNERGLSDLLAGASELPDVVNQSEVECLRFISHGTVPPNPSELLMTEALPQLLERVTANYDLVIVDTPPIHAVTDAALLGRHAGSSMMVARFAVNSIKEIEAARTRFAQNGVDIRGVVFNGVVRKTARYNDGYYNYRYSSST